MTSLRSRVNRVHQAKEENLRERNRLQSKISGHRGIEANCRMKIQQTQDECDDVRKELAQIFFQQRRKMAQRDRLFGQRLSRDTDPSLLLMREREDLRKRKNNRLLIKARDQQEEMTGLVKNFVAKMDDEKRVSSSVKGVRTFRGTSPEKSNKSDVAEDAHFMTTPYMVTSQSPLDWEEVRKTRYLFSPAIAH
ncbi:uncharacterized protein LOC143465070 isoform X2 [Clavelina lepadiformis]|uniref:uncharacterized protein LOC143465070 isoform X2 n=1 Tax=Clavelina lepadiformis TaxID=159417 RepID=UPI0040436FDC